MIGGTLTNTSYSRHFDGKKIGGTRRRRGGHQITNISNKPIGKSTGKGNTLRHNPARAFFIGRKGGGLKFNLKKHPIKTRNLNMLIPVGGRKSRKARRSSRRRSSRKSRGGTMSGSDAAATMLGPLDPKNWHHTGKYRR